jgi:uncharacterized NAD-dependent epimerase/dehydratase family protein
VRALALNTALLETAEAAAAVARLADATGLPVVDPVRQGGDVLLDAVLAVTASATPGGDPVPSTLKSG